MKFSSLNPARFVANRAAVLALVILLQQGINAHSWVEQVSNVAPNGTMVGQPGYIRAWRGRQGFEESLFSYLVPPNGRPTNGVLPEDKICARVQQLNTYSNDYPMLTTSPGNFIAMRYQENGHVTLPQNQKFKPKNRGTIYIYGTTEATNDDKFLDVRAWNAGGTGGNKKGRLLATRNYDDQRCYQENASGIYKERSAALNRKNDALQGPNFWCQSDIQLPSDLAVTAAGKPYTIYWLWAWPDMSRMDCPTDQNDPANNCTVAKEEFYTSCLDVNVVALAGGVKAAGADAPAAYAANQDPNNAADPKQMTVGQWQVKVSSFDARPPSSTGAPASSTGGVFIPSPAPTSTAAPTSSSAPGKKQPVKTVTVTVPQATTTVYVDAPAKPASNPSRRVRREAGEWRLGH